jgi:hypothetical protein
MGKGESISSKHKKIGPALTSTPARIFKEASFYGFKISQSYMSFRVAMHKAPQARHSLAPSVPEVRLRTEGLGRG